MALNQFNPRDAYVTHLQTLSANTRGSLQRPAYKCKHNIRQLLLTQPPRFHKGVVESFVRQFLALKTRKQ